MKKIIIGAIVFFFILTSVIFFRPYNNVELNAATIYYQSYSQLHRTVNQYVDMLEQYNNTADEVYLERALVKIDSIRDNITIFKLAHQIDFRNTLINQKVVKTDVFTLKNFEKFRSNYDYSWDLLNQLIEDTDNGLDDGAFQEFLHYNQLILSGLATEDIGYDPEKKEFRVVLDDSKASSFEEGLTGLQEIARKELTP